jgi:2'-5' RNA ligase
MGTPPQGNEPLVRVFVCVSPPEDVAGKIGRFIEKLGRFSGFKWVGREQLHITLKFLGEVTPERVVGLDTNLSKIGGLRPFDVTFSEVGAFPEMARASVLWLGVSDGGEKLSKLASSVDRASVASGCEAERRKFHPHLTIGRARRGNSSGGLPGGLFEALSGAPVVSWTCAGFTLMRSVLSAGGPEYTPVGNYPMI